jgi:hypothetical protein
MFTLVDLGIFVAVVCFIQILLQNTNIEDNQDNLACTPLEIREIAKNTVRFFHWTLPVLDIFSNLN